MGRKLDVQDEQHDGQDDEQDSAQVRRKAPERDEGKEQGYSAGNAGRHETRVGQLEDDPEHPDDEQDVGDVGVHQEPQEPVMKLRVKGRSSAPMVCRTMVPRGMSTVRPSTFFSKSSRSLAEKSTTLRDTASVSVRDMLRRTAWSAQSTFL